ncbi:response regulator transcription factor [Paenibacillus tuaregi]|uniref:response regulator transcription factor n=1 Tax=Paenibacillus tuaregi TaxID=1816681 RepID=UPI0008381099|nr:response regulator transcription factor [Paenibacillus tuaregi]
MTKIMVVDDDPYIRELIGLFLKDEGMEVVEKQNGTEAWEYYTHFPVDLSIVDIMMPEMDGWELCQRLREKGSQPILMITAKSETEDVIKGFRLGTDDYICKPFEPIEMVMRVKALLRRYGVSFSNKLTLGRITLDKISYLVKLTNPEAEWVLPLKEFELLYKLASYPGQIFTRDMLIRDIWGYSYMGDERTVDTHIKRLRDRFRNHTDDFRIVTMRGIGYRLETDHD